jgi:hypothetical protein
LAKVLAYNGKINSWAYQWFFSGLIQDGLAIIPNTNLVSNLGFDSRATNTKYNAKYYYNLKTKDLIFPLHHPKEITQHYEADIYSHYKLNEVTFIRRIYTLLNRVFQYNLVSKILRKNWK